MAITVAVNNVHCKKEALTDRTWSFLRAWVIKCTNSWPTSGSVYALTTEYLNADVMSFPKLVPWWIPQSRFFCCRGAPAVRNIRPIQLGRSTAAIRKIFISPETIVIDSYKLYIFFRFPHHYTSCTTHLNSSKYLSGLNLLFGAFHEGVNTSLLGIYHVFSPGPGPGRYALPPTIGFIGHDFTKPTSPAYSFHTRMSNNRKFRSQNSSKPYKTVIPKV